MIKKKQQATIPVEQMFSVLQTENAAVRAMWTREIVGEGKKVGLKFDEHWRDADLDAGPLPALFLRETAKSMEKSPVRISLFLGSDYPISPDNRFEGLQQEKFQALRQSRQAQFFYVPDTGLHTAMFADIAVAEPCISCHNKHEQSPKHDWRLNDVMGAATWMYPESVVTLQDTLKAITVLHQVFGIPIRHTWIKSLPLRIRPLSVSTGRATAIICPAWRCSCRRFYNARPRIRCRFWAI